MGEPSICPWHYWFTDLHAPRKREHERNTSFDSRVIKYQIVGNPVNAASTHLSCEGMCLVYNKMQINNKGMKTISAYNYL